MHNLQGKGNLNNKSKSSKKTEKRKRRNKEDPEKGKIRKLGKKYLFKSNFVTNYIKGKNVLHNLINILCLLDYLKNNREFYKSWLKSYSYVKKLQQNSLLCKILSSEISVIHDQS